MATPLSQLRMIGGTAPALRGGASIGTRALACASLALCASLASCEGRSSAPKTQPSLAEQAGPSGARTREDGALRDARARMVQQQIAARGVSDGRVLNAMRQVPRHEFVLPAYRERAYDDAPLPIEAEQTISQPYIVALMTELADIQPRDRVLEVGTGSGYQAAVLAQLGAEVRSIEIIEKLARSAHARLQRLGYSVKVRHGDGYAGWPEHAPFDAILVTAAPPSIPPPLEAQLAVGGKLVVPVGDDYQQLVVVERTTDGYERRSVAPVRFVPMTGRARNGK
jgi:protein-L-isoaspartate(D-aspartate) O-methyltransferase